MSSISKKIVQLSMALALVMGVSISSAQPVEAGNRGGRLAAGIFLGVIGGAIIASEVRRSERRRHRRRSHRARYRNDNHYLYSNYNRYDRKRRHRRHDRYRHRECWYNRYDERVCSYAR